MRRLLTLVGVGLAIYGSVPLFGVAGRTYTTSFTGTENPISEGGNWINGQQVGIDWKDMRVAGGLAYGTQSGAGGPPYNDSTAVITGNWAPDQAVEAVVHTVNQQTGSVYEEVEIRLRTTITSHRLAGYEFNWRANHDGSQYHQIGYWYGPIGTSSCALNCAFAAVPNSINSSGDGMTAAFGNPGLFDGDTVGASIVGNHITSWVIHNGVKKVLENFNDTGGAGGGAYFTSGSPGMGHWMHGPGQFVSDFGFTRLTAWEVGSAPSSPTNVRIIPNH
jgi:hypothetical protein